MNQVPEQSKSFLMKTFAVVGFVVLVVVLAWVAIRVVTMLPAAFSSLASLADSIHNPQREAQTLTINTENSIINSQESFTISWADLKKKGTYTLIYECVDGVSLDIRTAGADIITLDCDNPYQLQEKTFSVDAVFSSEKSRFADVSYGIAFTQKDADQPLLETNKTLTLVNPSIPQSLVAGADTSDGVTSADNSEEEVAGTVTPTASAAYVPPQPKYTFVTTYGTPKSNPNGYTELAVSYNGVGKLVHGKDFVLTGTLDQDKQGAFQFKVKNTGTKTSTDWKFVATLTSGNEFKSKSQDPIKPNETVTVTVAFDEIGKEGIQRFGAEISGGNDRSSANNKFTWAVKVVD